MQCPSCGAPFDVDQHARRIKCPFCGTVTDLTRISGGRPPSADPDQLFQNGMYAACAKVSEEILATDPDDVVARLFSGLTELFGNPDDHYTIDRNLYYLLVDKTTTPVGRVATAFRNIRSATSESEEAHEVFIRRVCDYFRTRTVPDNYSSSFGTQVMRAIKFNK